MAEFKPKVTAVDPVWDRVCTEAQEAIRAEPLLGGLIHSSLLHHASMERALAYRFSMKLASGEMSEQILREIADQAYDSDPELGAAARADLMAVYDRDPACHRFIQPILFFKGYQAVQAYRIGHWLWEQGRKDLSYFVQMRVSEVFGVDIHPAAKVGKGLMIDHAHSIVIGETAVVGDNVSMLHSVTLGGTGKEDGDRHPKIGNGVLIGAGAKVSGQYHRRQLLAHRGGIGGVAGHSADEDGGGRSGQDRGRGGLFATRRVDGSQADGLCRLRLSVRYEKAPGSDCFRGLFCDFGCCQASMAIGFSRLSTMACISCAPSAPSMTR